MRTIATTFALLALALASCGRQPPAANPRVAAPGQDDSKPRLLFETPNSKAGLTARFFGTDIAADPGAGSKAIPMIDYLTLGESGGSRSITYRPETDTRQAADFYFKDVWSPDGRMLVLPLDKRDGFAIVNASSALTDVPAGKYADRIRVRHGTARRYWHRFDSWDGTTAIRFTGELDGRETRFRYDFATKALTCLETRCDDDHGENGSGAVTPVNR